MPRKEYSRLLPLFFLFTLGCILYLHAAYKYVPRWQHSAALPREDRGLHAEREGGKGGTSVSIRMELVGRALVPGELLLEVRK